MFGIRVSRERLPGVWIRRSTVVVIHTSHRAGPLDVAINFVTTPGIDGRLSFYQIHLAVEDSPNRFFFPTLRIRSTILLHPPAPLKCKGRATVGG